MKMKLMIPRTAWFCLLPLCIVFVLPGGAWAKDINELIQKRMNQIRGQQQITVDLQEIIDGGTEQQVLAALRTYEKDPAAQIRHAAYTLGWKVAKESRSAQIRQEQVVRLLNAAQDSAPLVWQHAAEHLLDFTSNDFSPLAREMIAARIHGKNPAKEMFLAAGVANMKEEEETIRKHLFDESIYETGDYTGRWYGTPGWSARLALARMGSGADERHAIKMVEAESDDVLRVTRLLNDLAYIRRPQAISTLQDYLENDKRLPRVKPTVPGTPFNQYAADLLARIIAGFPVQSVGPGGYSQQEIELCRQWMRNQTNWKIIR